MIPYAVVAYRATKHSATGFTSNFMVCGREISEPVDLVAGLPPDAEITPSGSELGASGGVAGDAEGASSLTSPDPALDISDSAPFSPSHPDFSVPGDPQASGCGVAKQCQQGHQWRPPVRFGEWAAH